MASEQSIPKTGIIAPGSTVQPRCILDLEGMVFSQGGHLMLNKKCKLPKGSLKRAKKGYEEIHILVPKQNPMDDAGLVPISSLLEWVEQTFPGAKSSGQAVPD